METPENPPADPARDQAASEPEASDLHALVGQVLAERYKIEALVGEGGMGAVYRARHVHMHKTVAVKVLHREMTAFPEAVARFEREAVACARIDHANVAAATDFGRLEDGSFYLVLEYVEGRSLRSLIAGNQPLPAASCIRIGKQIASALNAAHNQGIVHRDLKPENVMLIDRPGEPDCVKVLDFGIAKVAMDKADQPALTRMGAVFGTPDYMSPEQAMGRAVDARSDLYSLGVMLYEMASGHRPFDAEEAVTVLSAHISKEPPPLPEDVHPLLATLIRVLLAKAPENRLQTAAEVVKSFEEMAVTPGLATQLRLASPLVVKSGSFELPDGPVSGVLPTALAGLPAATGPGHTDPTGAISTSNNLPSVVIVRTQAPAEPWWQPLEKSAKALLAQAVQAAPMLLRPVKVGTVSVPAWSLGAVPIAGFFGLILFIWILSALFRSSPKPMLPAMASASSLVAPASSSPIRPTRDAKGPLPEDVQRIESIPIYKRKLEDWMALGRGYAEAGQSRDSALAYRAALQLDKAPRSDPQMLADLRMIAQDPDAYGLVVNVCEGGRRGLGETGFHLLWDLYNDFLSKPDQQGSAEATLKKLVILSRRTPNALRVAIELQSSNGCETISGLLERAAKYADQRAAPRLHQLESTSGCGVDKSEDCWPCLRGSDALAAAIKGAEGRPAPKIDNGYR